MLNKFIMTVLVSTVLMEPSLCRSATDTTLGRYDITFKLNNNVYVDSILIDQSLGEKKYGGHVIGGTKVTALKNSKLFCISVTDAVAFGESWCIELQGKKNMTATYTGTVSGHCSEATPAYTGVTVPALARKVKANRSRSYTGIAGDEAPENFGLSADRMLLQRAADIRSVAIP